MMNLVFKLIIFKILNSLLKVFKLSLNKLSIIRIRLKLSNRTSFHLISYFEKSKIRVINYKTLFDKERA